MLIFGTAGACRRCELTDLTIKDVQILGEIVYVTLWDKKKSEDREFVINEGVVPNVNLVDVIKKYMELRSKVVTTDRFFLNFRGGKFVAQPVGINTIGGMPQKVAEFSGIQNANLYTGHCYRRTSATLLVDSSADLIALKNHGGWKSSKVAESSKR